MTRREAALCLGSSAWEAVSLDVVGASTRKKACLRGKPTERKEEVSEMEEIGPNVIT